MRDYLRIAFKVVAYTLLVIFGSLFFITELSSTAIAGLTYLSTPKNTEQFFLGASITLFYLALVFSVYIYIKTLDLYQTTNWICLMLFAGGLMLICKMINFGFNLTTGIIALVFFICSFSWSRYRDFFFPLEESTAL